MSVGPIITRTSRRSVGRCLLGAGALILMPTQLAYAQDSSIKLRISKRKVAIGEPVVLRVDVASGGRTKVGKPRFPDFEGLEIEQRGMGQSIQNVTAQGRVTSETTRSYTYMLTAKQAGEFELAVTVTSGGRTIKATQIPILTAVGTGADNGQRQAAADTPPQHEQPDAKGRDLFITAELDRSSVYVGEGVLYRSELWSRYRDISSQSPKLATFKDFWTEDLSAEQPGRREVVDGRPYEVNLLLERLVFPQRAGELAVGANELDIYQMRFPFGRGKRLDHVVGEAVVLEVKPLPAKGQPHGFLANNVGQFSVSASVDRDQIEEGDGFTLTVAVKGEGNIRFVQPDAWPEIEGVRRYEPTEDLQLSLTGAGRLRGTREYKFLMIADKSGEVTIPPHSIGFFDPTSETYRVGKSDEFRVKVVGGSKGGGKKSDDLAAKDAVSPRGRGAVERSPDNSGLDAVHSGSTLERTPKDESATPLSSWALRTLAPPAAVLTGLAGFRLFKGLGPSDDAKSQAQRLAERKERRTRAESTVGDSNTFFPALAEFVHNYVLDRVGERGVGLARRPLMNLLRENGLAETTVVEITRILEQCDAARFGAATGSESEHRELFSKACVLFDAKDWRGGAA